MTLPSKLLQASLTSSIILSSQTATNDEPVPERPDAIAPDCKASIAIAESKPKVDA